MTSCIIKRNGAIVGFDSKRVFNAIQAAVSATGSCMSDGVIKDIVKDVSSSYNSMNNIVDVETIQDMIVNTLIAKGQLKVAEKYIAYRSNRTLKRERSNKYDDFMKIKFHDKSRPFKSAWVIAKAYDACTAVGYDATENSRLIEKAVDLAIKSVKENSDSNIIAVEDLGEALSSALFLYGLKKASSFIRGLHLSKTNIWAIDILKADEVIKKSIDEHYKVLKFKNGKKDIEIESSIFIELIKDMSEYAGFDFLTIKAKSLSSYTNGMHILDFYGKIVSLIKKYNEVDPGFSYKISEFILDGIYRAATDGKCCLKNRPGVQEFKDYLNKGILAGRIDSKLVKSYDLEKIAKSIDHSRDGLFKYLGIQTLLDRYLLRDNDQLIETPQFLFMRVGMGISLLEKDLNTRAIEAYNLLSNHKFMSSTPTLFNAGTLTPQLSSCYLSTTKDSLESIFNTVSEGAFKTKWAGGLGIDWTEVRGMSSRIKGTGGLSRGVVPFLKVLNSTCVAVNQGGKRLGTCAAYLEVWHKDIESFINLRKNTGEERLRTHDLSLAVWAPDLFMKRVEENKDWTLFCPSDVRGLHSLYGEEFEKQYAKYEAMAERGEIPCEKISALTLYRKILSSLFETGYPWLTFKDPANIRYTQKHEGVVHSSNLCTEIFEHTKAVDSDDPAGSEAEIAVCNLGSINLYAHIKDGKIDYDMLKSSVRTAARMLDNVIDINFYPVKAAETSSMKHRFIGMGYFGWHDLLISLGIRFDSDEAVELADEITEFISYYSIDASADLAQEKGSYKTFKGSEWSKGKVPFDTYKDLADYRGKYMNANFSHKQDWDIIRSKVKKGMRNALTMALAPTATIASIVGVTDSISPMFGVMYAKANLSGSFIHVADSVYKLLKSKGLWNRQLVEDLKYYDGSLQNIDFIPQELKELLKCAFEIAPIYLIRSAARRQKWIDQGQSLNVFFPHKNGKIIQEIYTEGWKRGLKSFYYLRSRSASTIEKTTVDINAKGVRASWSKSATASDNISIDRDNKAEFKIQCSLKDGCESCQ